MSRADVSSSDDITRERPPRSSIRVCLAGDTMLGRGLADALAGSERRRIFSDDVVALVRSADVALVNLECCISARGDPWPAPGKPFFFRAPPRAVDVMSELGVDCVTLANNHALDYGREALLDTLSHLKGAGIVAVGAGADFDAASSAAVVTRNRFRLAILGLTDHPADFAATTEHPGVAFADLKLGVPRWVTDRMASCESDAVLVTPHWGPNMTPRPPPYVRDAADGLVRAGASVVAGHSAHVFHGVRLPVLFDLGDFVDDYARDPFLRNDLGLLWFVTVDATGPRRVEAVPLKLENCYTRLATGDDLRWISERFRAACAEMGTDVEAAENSLVIAAQPGSEP